MLYRFFRDGFISLQMKVHFQVLHPFGISNLDIILTELIVAELRCTAPLRSNFIIGS